MGHHSSSHWTVATGADSCPTAATNPGYDSKHDGSLCAGAVGAYPNDGETLGLPNGMRIPGPFSPQVLLGLGSTWDCSSGLCIPGWGNTYDELAPFQVQHGSWGSYASCFVAGVLTHIKGDVLAVSGLSIIAGSRTGSWTGTGAERYGNVSLINKGPAKWGSKVAVVGAVLITADTVVAEDSIARGCSALTGYTPWILE